MNPLTPDQAVFILQTVSLPSVFLEHPTTKAVVKAIPADQTTFAPHPVARSAFDLAWHIVGAEIKYLRAAATGEFPFTARARPESLQTPADLVAWYSDQFAAEMNRLKDRAGERLLETIDFYGIRRLPALAFVQIGLNHTIHHRGQLSTYLRAMGAKVPSIYGESYDAREAREQRQQAGNGT